MSNMASLFRVLSLSLSVALFSSGLSSVTQAEEFEINATALQQIQALLEEKALLTPAQRKINIHLLHLLKKAKKTRGKEALTSSDFPNLRSFVKVDDEGTTLVDIKAEAEVIAQLGVLIVAQGGTIVSSVAEYGTIRARVPLEKIELLANSPYVQSVNPAIRAITNKLNTSEGDKAHHTLSARQSCGMDGTGIKIGVLSDSVDYLSDVQASGDLPHVTVLEDAQNNTGEGTALLEIIHDLAPGAELYFATAWKGPASFANNIKALRDEGCQIIVDDVNYLNESPFQDDLIAQAVNEVTADGVLYFSAAGNSGNLNKNQSGVWEGEFKGSDIVISDVGEIHDFEDGDITNEVIKEAPYAVTLFWADPLGHSTNDYDLFLLNSNGELVDVSRNWQTGSQDPFEIIGHALPGDQVVVVKYSGENRYLHLNTITGRLEYGTDGQIFGHAASENAFAIGAVSVETTAFNKSVEGFSSDGPRRVFYEADGTAITPGDFSATGGKIRLKPDFVAANGVMTAMPSQNPFFSPFYGTSAAAAHAAAIAGLLLSGNPSLTPAQIRAKLTQTALDIEAPGWDRDSGAGIIMAHDCLSYGVNDAGLNNSQLFTFNPNVPNEHYTVQALGPLYTGHDIEGLALSSDSRLYATSGNDTEGKLPHGHLYKVNKNTGQLDSIGSTGFGEVSAISFRPNNQNGESTLWGWADGKGLIEIDTLTGDGTMIAPYHQKIEAITCSHDGQFLYGVEGTVLYQYQFATGELLPICDNLPFEAEAIVMLADGNLLMGFHEANDSAIHSFNISNCSITKSIDSPYTDIEAMTFRYDWSSTAQMPESEMPEEEIPDEEIPENEITTVRIANDVLVPETIPLGINLGGDSYYGPGVLLKVRDAENFEGTSYRQIHQGTLFKDGFASCSGRLPLYEKTGWADLMRNGGQYTLISGPAKWTTGKITTVSSRTLTCWRNQVEGLFFAFDTEIVLPDDNSIPEMGLLVENLEPVKQGHLGKPGSYWAPSTNCSVENDSPPESFGYASLAMNGIEKEATFRLSTHKQEYANLNGLWKYRFWAKVKEGEPKVVISSGKYGEVQGVDLSVSEWSETQEIEFYSAFPEFLEFYENGQKETDIGEDFAKTFVMFGSEIKHPVEMTASDWKQYEVTLQIHDVPEQTSNGGSPFLDFRISVTNGILLVDDLEVKMVGDKNPTAFRDEIVTALKSYNPGVIRKLQMGGNTLESTIMPRLKSYRGTYNFYSKVGSEEIRSLQSYGLHEFYELAEYVGSEPWFSLPGTMTQEEMAQFIEYLAAPATVGWGKRRAELGHPIPWTDSLRKIHVEIGNEAWNTFFQGSGFNGADYWHDLFATAKDSPYYHENIILHAAGQKYSSWMANRILTNTPNADRYAIAPYQLHSLNQGDVELFQNDEELFSWLFARSLYEIENSMLGHKEVMNDTGVEYSIYEINHHTLKGDVEHELRNHIVSSLGAGLNISNTMLQLLKKYKIKTQAFFNFSQFSFNMRFYHLDDFNVRLWGSGINFRQGYERYRPTWLANELVNKVLAGNLLETLHTGANPTQTVTGTFEYNGVPETKNGFPEILSYAFANGNKRGIILYNVSTTMPHVVSIEFDGNHNALNASAKSELLTASSVAANNEPENSEPQVHVVKTTIDGFQSGIRIRLPQHSLRVISWESP